MKDQQIHIHPIQVSFAIDVATDEKEPDPETVRLTIADEIDFNPKIIEFEHDGPPRAAWVGGDE
jgi:hypothetical protein